MSTMLEDRQAALERENAELRRQLDICHAELEEAREEQTATVEACWGSSVPRRVISPRFLTRCSKRRRVLCDAALPRIFWVYDGTRFQCRCDPRHSRRRSPRRCGTLQSTSALQNAFSVANRYVAGRRPRGD